MSYLKDPSDLADSFDSTSSYTMMYSKSGISSQMATLTAQPPPLHFDFLSFLGIAQKLQVRFLPLTWQPVLDGQDKLAGVGGTAEIRQSLVRFDESFVFKLIKPVERAKWSEHKILQMLVSEIIVLTHPRVKGHLNVLSLQGICWDVTVEGKAWPVLVFEKAQFGNLEEFAMGKGKGLSFQDRRKLCADIGTAMRHFHACQIIHGDIKPQNVLIFKTERGGYIAKVTDFGYSTMYAGHGLIEMPYSKIWTAPEWGQRGGYKFSEAQKMDSYSFGLLCLWLLFYAPLVDGDFIFCNELRLGTRKSVLAEQSITARPELGVHERNQFRRFFELTLADNPAERDSDFALLLELLTSHSSPFLHDPASFLENTPITPPPDFQLLPSIFELCRTHHGVRAYIAECLKQRASISSPISSQHAAYELAICYKLGFGVERDNDRSEFLLKQTKRFGIQLEHEITRLKLMSEKPTPRGGLYNQLKYEGLLPFASTVEHYLNLGQINDIVPRLTKEVHDTEATLGAEHGVPLILKSGLCQVLGQLEEWDKAEILQTQVMQINMAIRGQKHPETMASMHQLARIFYGQKRWKDAEKLQTQVMSFRPSTSYLISPDLIDEWVSLAKTYYAQERWKEAEELQLRSVKEKQKLLGPDHSSTEKSMASLGHMYLDQGRFRDAEEVYTKVMEREKRVLGSQHPNTLSSMIILGFILGEQKRWKEAEELYIQMMQAQLGSSGPEHPHNLTAMTHLGFLYRGQGRLREAEKLHMQVMEMREKAQGPEDPITLRAFTNLAKTYEAQNRWREAEDLLVQVVKTNETVLGAKCIETMESMSSLAGNYQGQKEWAKAEKLQMTVVQTSISILGQKNSRTLIHMHNLACMLFHQKRWIEAEKLQTQVIEISIEALGPGHSQTLNSTGWLALTYQNQGRWKEAETLLTQVHEKTHTASGCGNSNELFRCLIMSHLATLYRKQERWEEAEKLFVEVVDRYLVIHGQEHISTVNSMSHLSLIYRKQERWKEAEKWALQALAISKKMLGPEHPDTLLIMSRLATIYNGQGQLKEKPLEVEMTVPMTDAMVIEHSSPAHRIAGQDPCWTAQRYRDEGRDLLSQVVVTSKRILGLDHHSTIARIKVLDEWANISQTASP